jgi:hypothetical protein
VLFKIIETGRPIGAFHFFRSGTEPDFTDRDYRILDALHGFIAHG